MVSLERVRTASAMLIDDDKVSNFIYRRVIESSGFFDDIQSFHSPRQALVKLEQLAETDPDSFPSIIFLDLNMPEMNGWQFLDVYELVIPKPVLLKSNVCILSSSVYLQDKLRSNEYECVKEYIPKPLTSSNLQNLYEKYVH